MHANDRFSNMFLLFFKSKRELKNHATKWISTSIELILNVCVCVRLCVPNNTNVSNHINICKCPANQKKTKRFNAIFSHIECVLTEAKANNFPYNRKKLPPIFFSSCAVSLFLCQQKYNRKVDNWMKNTIPKQHDINLRRGYDVERLFWYLTVGGLSNKLNGSD